MRINFLMAPEDSGAGAAGNTDAGKGTVTTPPAGSGEKAPTTDTVVGGELKTESADKGSEKDPGTGTKADHKDNAPVEIEVKFPDGVAADEAFLAEFKSTAKELKLDSAGAQKLVDLQMKAQKQAQSAAAEEWKSTQKQWVEAVKADKEIGGAKMAETQEICRQAVAKFGGKELSDFLNQTGFGNHPVVIRAFRKIGMAIREDNSAGRVGNGASAPDNKVKQRYPNTPSFHK